MLSFLIRDFLADMLGGGARGGGWVADSFLGGGRRAPHCQRTGGR